MAFPPQRSLNRGRPPRGRPCARTTLAPLQVPAGLPPCSLRSSPLSRRGQLHPCAARLGKPDRDCLFCGARSVLSLADMLHFFAHKFSGLSTRPLPLLLRLARPFDGLSFRHGYLASSEFFAGPALFGRLQSKKFAAHQKQPESSYPPFS